MEKIWELGGGLVKVYAEKFDSGEVKYSINRYVPSCAFPLWEPLEEGLSHELRVVVVTGAKGLMAYEVINRHFKTKRMIGQLEASQWLEYARKVCGEKFIKRGV